eukprot:CAMPEP_0180676926 /NCGR_PEP_ID=MMETSP1037_2-20121125/67580_1 /TAXON_ID=632150 /ORGANISM="Azadinium spinosum, Strain 3D9" /LENGTH=165 /DNA_ID=CAMNT_0022706477 /DNA_START=686 /DNA_END=1184 /DNA_ORIENTATION=-
MTLDACDPSTVLASALSTDLVKVPGLEMRQALGFGLVNLCIACRDIPLLVVNATELAAVGTLSWVILIAQIRLATNALVYSEPHAWQPFETVFGSDLVNALAVLTPVLGIIPRQTLEVPHALIEVLPLRIAHHVGPQVPKVIPQDEDPGQGGDTAKAREQGQCCE